MACANSRMEFWVFCVETRQLKLIMIFFSLNIFRLLSCFVRAFFSAFYRDFNLIRLFLHRKRPFECLEWYLLLIGCENTIDGQQWSRDARGKIIREIDRRQNRSDVDSTLSVNTENQQVMDVINTNSIPRGRGPLFNQVDAFWPRQYEKCQTFLEFRIQKLSVCVAKSILTFEELFNWKTFGRNVHCTCCIIELFFW